MLERKFTLVDKVVFVFEGVKYISGELIDGEGFSGVDL